MPYWKAWFTQMFGDSSRNDTKCVYDVLLGIQSAPITCVLHLMLTLCFVEYNLQECNPLIFVMLG